MAASPRPHPVLSAAPSVASSLGSFSVSESDSDYETNRAPPSRCHDSPHLLHKVCCLASLGRAAHMLRGMRPLGTAASRKLLRGTQPASLPAFAFALFYHGLGSSLWPCSYQVAVCPQDVLEHVQHTVRSADGPHRVRARGLGRTRFPSAFSLEVCVYAGCTRARRAHWTRCRCRPTQQTLRPGRTAPCCCAQGACRGSLCLGLTQNAST